MDITEQLCMFISGFLFCAALVLLINSRHLIQITKRVITHPISLIELLDSMVKQQEVKLATGMMKYEYS